jgi:orotidine-5'-phosphate decarboxylase
MTGWAAKLDAVADSARTQVCIGLDPDPALLPVADVLEFNRTIVDATRDLVCAYKPNLGFYEALGLDGLEALRATVRHIRSVAPGVVVVGDAKRGDIGSTARAYARAMFEVWDFDAVTVSPYLGRDSIEPFMAYEDRGAIILCRTSNPGARDIQDLPTGSGPLYLRVAELVESWNAAGNLGMVVGATYPEELAEIRAAHPTLPLLIPGVGAQGADVAKRGAGDRLDWQRLRPGQTLIVIWPRSSSESSAMPAPETTAVNGSSARTMGSLVSVRSSLSKSRSWAPPPTSTIPRSTMSAASSGGVRSSVWITLSMIWWIGS